MNCLLGFLLLFCLTRLKTGEAFSDHQIQKCFSECAVTGIRKFSYNPEVTYTYNYTGKSEVSVNGIPGATNNFQWAVNVDLKWETPCEFVLTLRDPVVMGTKDELLTKDLTTHPLMVGMSEGIVLGVCAHPQETSHSLNLKKGIVSALQNSLPSFSVIHSGKTYSEVDALGLCPTHYTVETKPSKYVITKSKIHKDCSRRLSKRTQTPVDILIQKSPLPLKASTSKCVQEISDGIIRSVQCEDHKEIIVSFANMKSILTSQNSHLIFTGMSSLKLPSLESKNYWKSDLTFDDYPSPQMEEFMPKVYKLLDEICQKTGDGVDRLAPRLITQLMHLMEKIPVKGLFKIFENIKNQKLCPNSHHLETMVMDILSFVKQEGSLKLMVDLLLDGHLTGMRQQLYLFSLFLRKDLSSASMKYLLPIFESSKNPPPALLLAAGHLMHKYCNYDSDCLTLPSIQKILKILSQKLHESCQNPEATDLQKKKSILTLKTIGNIGKMTKLLENEVLSCIYSDKMDTSVKIAAIESFRLVPCTQEFADKLLPQIHFHSNGRAETRTAAYLQFARCPNIDGLRKITAMLYSEEDGEVKSFIMSHLKYVLQEKFPSFQRLRNILVGMNLPRNITTADSNYSDLSYYISSFKSGISFQKSLISDNKMKFKKYDTTLQLAFLGELLTLGEVSLRINGHFPGTTGQTTFKDILNFETLSSVADLMLHDTKDDNLFLVDQEPSEIDVSLRALETEILFQSFKVTKSKPDSSVSDRPIKIIVTLMKLIEKLNLKELNSTRTLYSDLHTFIPTAQGIPILIKLEATTLLGLTILPSFQNLSNNVVMKPEFSSEVDSFVGYSFGPKLGIRSQNSIHLSSDIDTRLSTVPKNKAKVTINIPKPEVELIDIQSHVYMMKKLTEKEDIAIIPKEFNDKKMTHTTCLPPQFSFGGLHACWKLNVSNIFTSNSFPFGGPSSLTFYIKREPLQKSEIILNSSWKIKNQSKTLNLEMFTNGLNKKDKINMEFKSENDPNHQSIQLFTSWKEKKISLGLKLILEEKRVNSGNMKTLYLYSSEVNKFLSRDLVLFMRMIQKRDLTQNKSSLTFEMKTKNKLSPFLNVDIRVSTDVEFNDSVQETQSTPYSHASLYKIFNVPIKQPLGIPFKNSLKHPLTRELFFWFPTSFSIREFEVQLGSGDFQTRSYLRRVASDATASEYRLQTTLEAGASLGGARVTGDIAFRGVIDRSVVLTSTFKGEFGRSHLYCSRIDFTNDNHKLSFVWRTENLSENTPLAVVSFSRSNKYPSAIHITMEAEFVVFGLTPHYEMDGTIIEQKMDTYDISFSVKKEKMELLKVEGPTLIRILPEEIEEEINLDIALRQWGLYHLRAGHSASRKHFKAVLDLKSPTRSFIFIEVDQNLHKHGERYGRYHLHLLELAHMKCEVEKSLKLMKTKFSIDLLPASVNEQSLHGQTIVLYNLRKFHAKILSSKVNAVDEKVIVDATYDLSRSRRFFNVSGDVHAFSTQFLYDFELNLGPKKNKDTLKYVLIRIRNPDQEVFLLEALHHDKVYKTDIGDVTNSFHVGIHGNDVQVRSNFCYVFGPSVYDAQIAGHVNVSSHDVKDATIKFEVLMTPRLQHVDLLTKMSGGEASPNKNKTFPDIKSNTFSSDRLRKGLGRDLKIRLEALLPSKILHNVTLSFDSNSTKSILINFQAYRNRDKILDITIGGLNDTNMVIQLYGPTKTMEISSQVTTKKTSGASAKDSRNLLGGNRYENLKNRTGSESSPGFFLSNMIVSDLKLTGNQMENIFITLDTFERADGSFKTVVSLWSPTFQSKPRILFEYSLTPSIKSFEVSFQKESSLAFPVVLSGMLSSPTDQQTNVYGYIHTLNKYIEFTGSFQEERDTIPTHVGVGYTFNGSVRYSGGKMVNFSSGFSFPAFLQAGVSELGRGLAYEAKLGVKPKLAVLQIERLPENYTFSQLYSNDEQKSWNEVVKAAIGMYSPFLLHIDAFVSLDRWMEFWKASQDGLLNVRSITGDIIQSIWNEVFVQLLGENSSAVSSGLTSIYEDVTRRLVEIHAGVTGEQWFPNFSKWGKDIKHFLNQTISWIKKIGKKIKENWLQILHKLITEVAKIFDHIDRVTRPWLDYLIEHVQQVLNFLQKISDAWKTIEQILKYLRSSYLWQQTQNMTSSFNDFLDYEVRLIKQLFYIVEKNLVDGLEQFWHFFIVSFDLDNVYNLLKHGFHQNTTLAVLLKNIIDVSVEERKAYIDVKVPSLSTLSQFGYPKTFLDQFYGPYVNVGVWDALDLMIRREK